jgi:hypothetical protein
MRPKLCPYELVPDRLDWLSKVQSRSSQTSRARDWPIKIMAGQPGIEVYLKGGILVNDFTAVVGDSPRLAVAARSPESVTSGDVRTCRGNH